MPKEYLYEGIVSTKTDAYAFGICLLELLTGKEPRTPKLKQLVTRCLEGGAAVSDSSSSSSSSSTAGGGGSGGGSVGVGSTPGNKIGTSNIKKYHIGQEVSNLGPDKYCGYIRSIAPSTPGSTHGPGTLTIGEAPLTTATMSLEGGSRSISTVLDPR
jgi:hypothetical protein